MKKLICLVLCLVMSVLVLAGCADDEIGKDLEKYDKKDNSIPAMSLNVYIICGDKTTANAKSTVNRELTALAKRDFNTTLNMFFVSEADYVATITEKTVEGAKDRADIILINSADLLNQLVNNRLVADLTSYLSVDNKDYGKLNVKITPSILQASKITLPKTELDKNGNEVVAKDDEGNVIYDSPKFFCVPNNHVVGEYEYLIIDKEAARKAYMDYEDVAAFKSYEDTADLRATLQTIYGAAGDSYVKVVKGQYADKSSYEANGYFCNVITYPTVTQEEALETGFAVVNGTKDVNRCMQIIYAFNTDEEYRNMLQYGVLQSNYTMKDGIVERKLTGDTVYEMNLEYTGDVFEAYPCKDLWSAEDIADGRKQNSESVAYNAK